MSAWETAKSALRVIAPTVATVLGGPLAGSAVTALSNLLLGKPNASDEELASAIQSATPEQIIALKQLDLEYQKAEFAEAQNARSREAEFIKVGKRDWTMTYLVVFFTALYASIIFGAHFIVDNLERDTLTQVSTFLAAIVGYFFGNKTSKRL